MIKMFFKQLRGWEWKVDTFFHPGQSWLSFQIEQVIGMVMTLLAARALDRGDTVTYERILAGCRAMANAEKTAALMQYYGGKP